MFLQIYVFEYRGAMPHVLVFEPHEMQHALLLTNVRRILSICLLMSEK